MSRAVRRAADTWCVVVAAGEGRRFGGAKQFSALGGRRVLDWAVDAAARWCGGVIVVLPPASGLSGEMPAGDGGDGGVALDADVELVVVAGGASRSESVRCGLSRVPDGAEVVLVHDGARPLAGDDVFERVIAAVRCGADAAVPVVEMSDTVRRRDGGTLDRHELLAVQTPQGFRPDALRAAHAGGGDATDDATLVEAVGGTVVTVDGDSRNLKITAAHDLVVAQALLSQRHETASRAGAGDALTAPAAGDLRDAAGR